MIRKLVFLVLAILSTLSVQAADSGPQYVQIGAIEVHPGAQPVYNAFIKKYIAASKKINSKTYFYTSTYDFGNPAMYTFALPHASFASMEPDFRNVLVEAFGKVEADKILKTIEGKVKSVNWAVWVQRKDLSPDQPDTSQSTVYLQGFASIKPRRAAQYEGFLKKLVEATNAVAPDEDYMMYSPSFGAPNTYVVGVSINGYADLDQPSENLLARLEKHFGKREAGKIWDRGAEVTEDLGWYIVRNRPDLSYTPE